MWERLPDVVRHYFELDPHRDGELFVALFSDDATVLDERHAYNGTNEIRDWREGPVTKYSYTTEVFGSEEIAPDRFLVTGRLRGNFPGETADLQWDFTISGAHISQLVIAPP